MARGSERRERFPYDDSVESFLGEPVTAQRLHDLGVVNLLCEPDTALEQAVLLAERLNRRAPNALASVKELLNEAGEATLNEQLASERDHFVKNLLHVNAGLGIDAFLAKQTPNFD